MSNSFFTWWDFLSCIELACKYLYSCYKARAKLNPHDFCSLIFGSHLFNIQNTDWCLLLGSAELFILCMHTAFLLTQLFAMQNKHFQWKIQKNIKALLQFLLSVPQTKQQYLGFNWYFKREDIEAAIYASSECVQNSGIFIFHTLGKIGETIKTQQVGRQNASSAVQAPEQSGKR